MITNEQRDEKLLQYYERGVLKQEIRSYEVSLWTLQDEFITVLKWSDVEQKGRIEKPKMTLNIDGTEKFTFTIPMYYRLHGQLIENPNWYNTQNGNLITGLRKLKVILNKGESEEAVFEFVIIDVKESHEKDIKTCEVSAEGLAFQELGKIGYKLSLTQEVFEAQYEEWDTSTDGKWTRRDGTKVNGQPLQTVDYWCKEAGLVELPATLTEVRSNPSLINSHTWYYTICMNWKSFADGISARSSNKVYEEPYTSSWTTDLAPSANENYREMARTIECENSNLYNITQSIAEKFQIFCRYEYIHDANYHIAGKIIIFYNNFLQEEDGTLSFIYPYSISKTERTMECADTTTKLYVLDVENDTTLEGVHTIMNAPCNASREDYILDFSYMYATGAITKDQWEAIHPYEVKMREYNDKLIGLQQQLMTYQTQLPELEAKCTVAKNSLDLDKEQVLQNNALLNKLDEIDGVSDGLVDQTTPDYLMVLTHEEGYKYINLKNTNKGIKEDTVKIYTTFAASGPTLSNPINSFKFDYDEYDNITAIIFTQTVTAQSVYLTYSYDPKLYYQKILNIWTVKSNDDRVKYEEALREIGPTSTTDTEYDLSAVYSYYAAELNLSHQNYNIASIAEKFYAQQAAYDAGLNKRINEVETEIETETRKKQEDIQQFERLMGPALREGYWQPEDYNDYGDHQNYSGTIAEEGIIEDSGSSAIIAWDETLFDGEDKLYYETGINQTKEYYPCIDLSIVFPNGIPSELSDYSVVWKANANSTYDFNSIKDIQQFAVGSQALIKFIKYNNHLTPILMLVGAKTFSAAQLARLTGAAGAARIEKYTLSVSNGQASVTHSNNTNISANAWILIEADTDPSITPILYPRIKFSSLALKTDTSNLTIKYDGNPLKSGYDYYINVRDTLRNSLYYTEYYITVKPESLIKYGYTAAKQFNINYVLSNANTAIYLDALKVSKENAWPKVSYSVSTNILNTDITHTLYNKRAQIVMINDFELKFNNVFGYISGLELDLDQPQNDTIEVKNYKTKFEDLFSTITAQTEEMKRAGSTFPAAMEGNVALSHTGFMETLTQNEIMFNAYLDSYFDSSQVVKDKLASLFTEAGEILSDSNKVLGSMRALTLKNADILANFAQDIAQELTVSVYKQATKPTKYKPGDIWVDDEGNRYVATSGNDVGGTGNTSGFVKTWDGTLAQITGAKMEYDANEGIVDIYGEHEINLRSGEHVYIAAGDTVDIVGNRAVNIGGGSVNIAGDSTNGYGAGGVHIVSSGVNFNATDTNIDTAIANAIASKDPNISKVLIDPGQIELGGANILMRGANLFQMVASRGSSNNTSAIEINPDDGIWIGSGKGVRIFSGGFQYNADTNTLTKGALTGASVELNDKHLILGFMEVNKTSNDSTLGNVIEMTKEYMILASGSPLDGTSNDADLQITGLTPTSSNHSLVGAKFTKDSIGFATYTSDTMNAVIMNDNGITIGSSDGGIDLANSTSTQLKTYFDNTSNADRGSYVRVAASGVEIGSLADLYVNTNNFKLQTNAANSTSGSIGTTILAIGTNLNGITSNTDLTTLNASSSVSFIINKNGAYINGYVYASGGSFTGDVIANSFKAIGNNGLFAADSNHFGLYKKGNNNSIGGDIITFDSSGNMTVSENLTITSGKNFTITSSNFKVNPAASGGADYFYVGDSGNSPSSCIRYVSAQTVNNETTAAHLEVKGAIIATSFTLGSTEIALDSNGHLPSSLIDSSSYSVNGISTIKWGSPASSKTTYVGLTSNTDGGLLLGANKDIIIPRVAPNNDDSTADTTDTIVKINKNGIKFNAYNSSGTETAHIYLDSDGLSVSGNRIAINGKDVWARDDIIILHAGDGQTVANAEATMSGKHDWVLIKPYYDATATFTNQIYTSVPANSANSEARIYLNNESNTVFGTIGSEQKYTYTISFKLVGNTASSSNFKMRLEIGTSSNTQNLSIPVSSDVTCISNIEAADNEELYSLSYGTITNPETVKFTFKSSTNICEEDCWVNFYLKNMWAVAGLAIDDFVLVATCPQTTSRVPCTVYYYP